MRIRVLKGVSSELLPLYERYECRVELEVFSLNYRANVEEVMPDACGRA